jgi:glutathione-regulated potassium-efflux system ancillary protein KefC
MDFEWVAIGASDVVWITVTFSLGFLARLVGLPPLVGFLAAGFLLNTQGIDNGELLQKLSDLGITLLLFTVGLKLNLRTLVRPQVWAVTGIHMAVVVVCFAVVTYALALVGVSHFAALGFGESLLIAFALSFSSTVFVVKVLEERGESTSLHGRVAIGILLMQDVAAVMFLAVSTGQAPSAWALLLILLFPLRPLLHGLLQRIGHGELLVLYGFLLALGGAEAFELVGLKSDLGALALGIVIASHPKAEEMTKAMLGFKDLFLLGFFLSIGLSGEPSLETVAIAVLMTPLVLFKSALFFFLLTRFRLRARTSLLATLNLTNYSEFGLIVAAIGVTNGWIGNEWLIVIAIALSLSFVVSAVLSKFSHRLYARHRGTWWRYQQGELIADDRFLDLGGATIAVIGMGGVGTGAYDAMRVQFGETVVGIDIDPVTTANQRAMGRSVLCGDASDADFWDRVQASHTLETVMLTLPKRSATLAVLNRLRETSFAGRIAAIARFPDEAEALKEAGAEIVFNMYTEAGAGFATHVTNEFAASRSQA